MAGNPRSIALIGPGKPGATVGTAAVLLDGTRVTTTPEDGAFRTVYGPDGISWLVSLPPSNTRSEFRLGGSKAPIWPEAEGESGYQYIDVAVGQDTSAGRVIKQRHSGDRSPVLSIQAEDGRWIFKRRGGPTPITGEVSDRQRFESYNGPPIVPSQRIKILVRYVFSPVEGNGSINVRYRYDDSDEWQPWADDSGFMLGYSSGNAGTYAKLCGIYSYNAHGLLTSQVWADVEGGFVSEQEVLAAAGVSGEPDPDPCRSIREALAQTVSDLNAARDARDQALQHARDLQEKIDAARSALA